MYVLAQFWGFKIFALARRCQEGFFTNPNLQSILYCFSFLTLSIPTCSKIWALVKSDCFSHIRFSLFSSWWSKYLKSFSSLHFLNFVTFSTAFFLSFNDLFKASLISSMWTFSLSLTLLFCILKQLLDTFPFPIFQYILVEGDPNASFSIANTPRCRGERYAIHWVAPLYPNLIRLC